MIGDDYGFRRTFNGYVMFKGVTLNILLDM